MIVKDAEEINEEVEVDKYQHQKDTFAMWDLLSEKARELIMMAPMNQVKDGKDS